MIDDATIARIRAGEEVTLVVPAVELTYPAAKQALENYGASYAEYIQTSMAEHVAKGHYTEEHAQQCNLGDVLRGNDGI